jgi:hypothetical protein
MGDETVVPLTGLATVIFDAKAGLERMSPEKIAAATRTHRFGVWPECEQYSCTNNGILLRGVRDESTFVLQNA